MFDFLFKNKKGETSSIVETITVELKKLALSKLAIEKAIGMIAHAIAKSEFVVQRKDGREKDHVYWILNIRPNRNETATDFWIAVIKKLLIESECLVCNVSGMLYMADTFTADRAVIMPRVYKNITIISGGETFRLDKNFRSDEVMHLRARNLKAIRNLRWISLGSFRSCGRKTGLGAREPLRSTNTKRASKKFLNRKKSRSC